MISRALFTIIALLSPVAAFAVTVPTYEATGTAFYDGDIDSDFLADFLDTDGDETDISAVLELSGADASGALLISDFGADPILESSTVLDLAFNILDPMADGTPTQDTVSILFGDLTGRDAGHYGPTALAVFSFFAEGDVNGFVDPVTARVIVAPIPLPASLPLLALGLGLIGAVARRRHRT